MKPKNKLGPEIFDKVYNKWAVENNALISGAYSNKQFIIRYENLGHRRKEKFDSLVFSHGLHVRRDHGKYCLEVLDPDSGESTMFLMQYM